MAKDFKDPIAVRNQKPKNQPVNGKNSPWDFRSPSYDQRSSPFVNAGTYYGKGYTNPVGHKGEARDFVDTMPSNSFTKITPEEEYYG